MPRREDERWVRSGLRWCVHCQKYLSEVEWAFHPHNPAARRVAPARTGRGAVPRSGGGRTGVRALVVIGALVAVAAGSAVALGSLDENPIFQSPDTSGGPVTINSESEPVVMAETPTPTPPRARGVNTPTPVPPEVIARLTANPPTPTPTPAPSPTPRSEFFLVMTAELEWTSSAGNVGRNNPPWSANGEWHSDWAKQRVKFVNRSVFPLLEEHLVITAEADNGTEGYKPAIGGFEWPIKPKSSLGAILTAQFPKGYNETADVTFKVAYTEPGREFGPVIPKPKP